jgi:hypothetical protein
MLLSCGKAHATKRPFGDDPRPPFPPFPAISVPDRPLHCCRPLGGPHFQRENVVQNPGKILGIRQTPEKSDWNRVKLNMPWGVKIDTSYLGKSTWCSFHGVVKLIPTHRAHAIWNLLDLAWKCRSRKNLELKWNDIIDMLHHSFQVCIYIYINIHIYLYIYKYTNHG